ncbi:MAG TPA: MmgE/PrpD family protein [Bryobacteraceae bacterium]|nr:MmgE/PrpD family protein [Bryobacteraceae bacterium]
MVRAARSFTDLSPDAIAKVKIALLDFLSCAFESLDLPPSKQAIKVAGGAGGGPASVIGTSVRASAAEAAFANAVLGHGLVREDMHTGSVSHLGIVIFPTLLALSQPRKITGQNFIRAAVCGYEVGASVGRALMDQETVRIFRPTGITGPLGAAVAGSVMLGFTEDAGVSALGLAANATGGLNEWPASGADDMFFHAGFAARNAVTSVELAELGAFGSETALDGPAGLFAALRRADRVAHVTPFRGDSLEIFSVYHKPAPACNYAQTACQAALAIGVPSRDIAAVQVRCTAAAIHYPGCNAPGPFERVLQAKMSIHFCVAATLARQSIEESNYRRLDDLEIARLIGVTKLEEDPELTQAYPRLQGSEVIVTLRDGRVLRKKMSDLVPATPDQIRARFRSAAGAAAVRIEERVEALEKLTDAGSIAGV